MSKKPSRRKNTQLESEGAEFLVLGQLLIQRIHAYKNYSRMPGYDLVAINPTTQRVAKISVKSRWRTGATGFIAGDVKKIDCDFVVVARLNRGIGNDATQAGPPEFFVFPVKIIKTAKHSAWNRVEFRTIPHLKSYQDAWEEISEFLSKPARHG